MTKLKKLAYKLSLAIIDILMLLAANNLFAQTIDNKMADSISIVNNNKFQDSMESAQLKAIILKNNYIDTSVYRFNKQLKQQNGFFKFWKHKNDSLMRWETDKNTFQKEFPDLNNEYDALDSNVYHLILTVKQNNTLLKIWVHSVYNDIGWLHNWGGKSGDIIAIEEVTSKRDSVIIFKYVSTRTMYDFRDINKDGFVDFFTHFEGMNGIMAPINLFLFNPNTNKFDTQIEVPSDEFTVLDTTKNLFTTDGHRILDSAEADNGGSFSILYSFKGKRINWLYGLAYECKHVDGKHYIGSLDDIDDDGKLNGIYLFKFKKNDKNLYTKVFVKKILLRSSKGKEFSLSDYWPTHYKKLLGYK